MKKLILRTDEEWHAARKGVITATEVSSVVGCNKYQSAAKMWDNKHNGTFRGNAFTIIGQILEPLVVRAANHHLGTKFKLYEDLEGGAKSFFIEEEINMGATPDACMPGALLECKTTRSGNILKWRHCPNEQYLCQLYTQMMCTEMPVGYLVIMDCNLSQYSGQLKFPIIAFKLLTDPRIDAIIKSEVKRFWATIAADKTFRVNRKLTAELEWLLRINTTKLL